MSSRRKFMQTTALAGLGMSMIHSNLFAGIMNQEIPYKMTPLRNNVGFLRKKEGPLAG
jgi:L-rhamnose isomerase